MDPAFKIRRHLTPPRATPAPHGAPEQRRSVRREVSDRVVLRGPRGSQDGWALNITRDGVRVIGEREVELGEVLEITVGLEDASPLVRQGRVVWIQEEADGFIAGIAFLGNQTAGRDDGAAPESALARSSA